jgi:hypothetical protein
MGAVKVGRIETPLKLVGVVSLASLLVSRVDG